jgi:hypothetical protein
LIPLAFRNSVWRIPVEDGEEVKVLVIGLEPPTSSERHEDSLHEAHVTWAARVTIRGKSSQIASLVR